MPRRIGLIGGECTGKSTLAAALADALPGCVATEALRDRVLRDGRPPRREEQRAILAEQAAREAAVAASCPHAVVIGDPAPLMTAVYSDLYFADRSLLPEALAHAQGYALLVWCAPDLPWTPDPGLRDGADHRDRADRLIASLVADELLPRGIPVVHVVGDVTSRVAAVLRAWQPSPSGPPT